MNTRTLSLLLTLGIAELAWLIAARSAIGLPWVDVNKGLATVFLGFLAAHVLEGWSERGKRSAGRKDDDRG